MQEPFMLHIQFNSGNALLLPAKIMAGLNQIALSLWQSGSTSAITNDYYDTYVYD